LTAFIPLAAREATMTFLATGSLKPALHIEDAILELCGANVPRKVLGTEIHLYIERKYIGWSESFWTDFKNFNIFQTKNARKLQEVPN
jgi:hypothetical protein